MNIFSQKSQDDEVNVSHITMNKYKCPVYRNSIRAGSPNDQIKNFVVPIELDCVENPEFWILRGACMILQTDD